MVPDGWERPSVGDVFEVQLGKMLNKAAKSGPEQRGYLTNVNVRWGRFELSSLNQMHFSDRDRRKFRLRKGDLIVCEGGEVGRCAIWRGEIDECYYQKALHRLRPLNGTVVPEFAYLFFEHGNEVGLFKNHSTRSSIAHLTREKLLQVPILLPPLPEQRKIADILSTWDEAIETSEALLATARRQKRALMQSLLTGKRRFPEFEGQDWKEVRIGDVLEEVRRPVEWSDDDLYRLISVRRRSGGLFHREDLFGREIKTKNLKHAQRGDFLISKMQVVHGAMGLVRDAFDGMQISGSYIAVVSKDPNELNIEFFDWLSRLPMMYHQTYLCSYGVHIEKMTFNFGLFLREKINMPSTAEEQSRIVEVLECAEQKERGLEAQIEKLRTEKKALMQQLLTGKRRVVVDA